MRKSSWFTALAATALLLIASAGPARAQFYYVAPPAPYFVYPSYSISINRAPAYGPYYGQGLSFIQPGSTSYTVFPSLSYAPLFSYGSPISYYSPAQAHYSRFYTPPVVTGNPLVYTPPPYVPYTSPLIYRGR